VNEHDWLCATNPNSMLEWLYTSKKAERRQLEYYFGECCRLIPRSQVQRAHHFDLDEDDHNQDALTQAQFHLGSAICEAIRMIGNGNGEPAYLVTVLRDIFGNPFRPITLDPRWLTSSVLDLAGAIYEERAFERVPILADALMDAGCENEDILDHCRGDGVHVRGCWVVDLLLGKE
jgi:hypothetical protein